MLEGIAQLSLKLLVLGTREVDLFLFVSAVPCLSCVQPLSLGLKCPTCFVLRLSLRQAPTQLRPFPIRFQVELFSNRPDLFLCLRLCQFSRLPPTHPYPKSLYFSLSHS